MILSLRRHSRVRVESAGDLSWMRLTWVRLLSPTGVGRLTGIPEVSIDACVGRSMRHRGPGKAPIKAE